MKRLWSYFIYLLIVWGLFRYYVRLPEVIEELWFKPLLWLVPLFWWNLSLSPRLRIFGERWLYSLTLGLIIGLIYFAILRRFNFQILWSIDLLGVATATAVTEEITFSGFVTGYLERIQKGKWLNLIIVGLMVSLIRLPILLLVYRLGVKDLVGVIILAFASGVLNAWIRVETGNVAGSILARVGMNLVALGI